LETIQIYRNGKRSHLVHYTCSKCKEEKHMLVSGGYRQRIERMSRMTGTTHYLCPGCKDSGFNPENPGGLMVVVGMAPDPAATQAFRGVITKEKFALGMLGKEMEDIKLKRTKLKIEMDQALGEYQDLVEQAKNMPKLIRKIRKWIRDAEDIVGVIRG